MGIAGRFARFFVAGSKELSLLTSSCKGSYEETLDGSITLASNEFS